MKEIFIRKCDIEDAFSQLYDLCKKKGIDLVVRTAEDKINLIKDAECIACVRGVNLTPPVDVTDILYDEEE